MIKTLFNFIRTIFSRTLEVMLSFQLKLKKFEMSVKFQLKTNNSLDGGDSL